jgi:hypothetical protein
VPDVITRVGSAPWPSGRRIAATRPPPRAGEAPPPRVRLVHRRAGGQELVDDVEPLVVGGERQGAQPVLVGEPAGWQAGQVTGRRGQLQALDPGAHATRTSSTSVMTNTAAQLVEVGPRGQVRHDDSFVPRGPRRGRKRSSPVLVNVRGGGLPARGPGGALRRQL